MSQNKSVEEIMKDFPCINSQCDGYGNIPHQVSEEEWEAEQCQFCFEYRFPLKELIQQERQTSQEREREIVEAILGEKTTRYTSDDSMIDVVDVDDIIAIAQKYNIPLTNPNKD